MRKHSNSHEPTHKLPYKPQENDADAEEPLPLDELDDLIPRLEEPSAIEEPDDAAISSEADDLENLAKEEPLDLLDNPSLVMELSEDPVRLYLKEIGGIELLDTDREF